MDFLLDHQLLKQDGTLVLAKSHLEKVRIIVFFFTGSHTTSDSTLMDTLKQVYSENLKKHCAIEVIYVPADSEEEDFQRGFKNHGPWTAVPCKDTLAVELRWIYDVTCIPQVIVVKKDDGSIITKKGTKELKQLGINVLVAWTEYLQR